MSAFYSTSSLGAFATHIPACDAWGNFKATDATSTAFVNGSGIQSPISRINTGAYGITFSPSIRSNLGSGGYVVLCTPEVSNPDTVCLLNVPRGSTATGSTAGFRIQTFGLRGVGVGGNTAELTDFTNNTLWVNFGCFHFSTALTTGNPSDVAYSPALPGGYGVTGATFTSHAASMLSTRSATAYASVVIPPRLGSSSTVSGYVEDYLNIRGLSFSNQNYSIDVFFDKPLNTADYCVLLSSEIEPPTQGSPDYASVGEYSVLFVDRSYKTREGFRIGCLRQLPSNNNWRRSNEHFQKGFSERINILVFGGGTYGQP